MPLDGAIEEIRALADRGTYQEADSRVRELINGNPTSVDAHHLLGLIQAGQGHREAARRAFERAIYLDPQHAPSLEHLALILEGAGERAAAGRLRDRANRTGAHRP
jgi:chemotaxis protein methyltransferase WspC